MQATPEDQSSRKDEFCAPMWRLVLCYDGGPFAGWQVQPGMPTVQGFLARAIERVTGERTLPQGSGRTDAGVHALAQVASVALQAPIPAENLKRALNHALPASIRVLDAQPAAADFHARHSALGKTYEYRVWQPEFCPPWQAPYVFHYTFRLHLEAMQSAAKAVLGTHDFFSFQAQQPDLADRTGTAAVQDKTTVRTVFSSVWEQPSPEMLIYRVSGSGFLHHMVRNLAGTFLDVGRGRIAVDSVAEILRARDRSAAGPTAPARGLWLHSVAYPGYADPVRY